MDHGCRRRSVLRIGGVALVGLTTGCSGSDPPGVDDDDGSATPTATGSPTATSEPETETETGAMTPEAFLADTSNFDGIVDRTGTDAVNVDVGVEGNGAFFAFGPPAIRVDAGTSITWTWTGNGGIHNVTAVQGADFESPLQSDAGAIFKQTVGTSGPILYGCDPHLGTGMKGAIVIA